MAEVDGIEARRVQQGVEQRVDAGNELEGIALQFCDHRLEVPRIDDQDVLPSQPEEQQAIRSQREHVVERNRCDQHGGVVLKLRPYPSLGLQHVAAYVFVRQHCALGDARSAAGVLQKGNVLRADVYAGVR